MSPPISWKSSTPHRITFTTTLINGARDVVFLVTGSGKAERLKEVLEGPIETDRLPSQLIRPTHGTAALAGRPGRRIAALGRSVP